MNEAGITARTMVCDSSRRFPVSCRNFELLEFAERRVMVRDPSLRPVRVRNIGFHEHGMSLVEVMVALVIGMFGVIIMMQVFGLFESQRRTTSSGDDAISSGSIALYELQRVVQQAGWGINTPMLMGCTVNPADPGPAFATSSLTALPLVPVTINSNLISGNDANTDTLLVVSGVSGGSIEGDEVTGTEVTTPSAFNAGDRVVGAPFSGLCESTTGTRKLGVFVAPKSVSIDTGMKRVYNLGATPVVRGYAIRGGNLTQCDFVASDCAVTANWQTIADNIVSLRAVYGRDTSFLAVSTGTVAAGSMDATVDVWDQTVPTLAGPNSAKNALGCSWARTSAVHIALVARSSQPERRQRQSNLTGGVDFNDIYAVTQAAPTWDYSGTFAINLESTMGGSLSWPMWKDFRYKVFQTAVPLRNITAKGVMPEC